MNELFSTIFLEKKPLLDIHFLSFFCPSDFLVFDIDFECET